MHSAARLNCYAIGYVEEAKAIGKKRELEKPKQTRAEFLSKFGIDDRLSPIITIVLYYGEEPWDGPTTFREMIGEVEAELEEYLPEYKLKIVELRGDKEYEFHNEEVEQLFQIAKGCFRKKELKEVGRTKVRKDVAHMLATILGADELVEKVEKEEEVEMCKFFEELKAEGERLGRQEGERLGRQEGEKLGRYEDRIELIMNQYKELSVEEVAKFLRCDKGVVEAVYQIQDIQGKAVGVKAVYDIFEEKGLLNQL